MFAEHFPPHILQHVAHLRDQNEKEKQFAVLSFVAGNVQAEDRRRVTHAIDANHQRPLDLGGSLQETLAVAPNHAANGNEQKGVNRDENDE